jgi:hypothetical protein
MTTEPALEHSIDGWSLAESQHQQVAHRALRLLTKAHLEG